MAQANTPEKQARLELFKATQRARQQASEAFKKSAAGTVKKVDAAKLKGEAALNAVIAELQPKIEELKGSDSLQAVIIRRQFKEAINKRSEVVKVRNEQQKTDRAIIKVQRAAGRTRTHEEQVRHDERVAKRAAKEAAAAAPAPVAVAVPKAKRIVVGSSPADAKNNTRTAAKGTTAPAAPRKRTPRATNSAQDLAAVTAPAVLDVKTQDYAAGANLATA